MERARIDIRIVESDQQKKSPLKKGQLPLVKNKDAGFLMNSTLFNAFSKAKDFYSDDFSLRFDYGFFDDQAGIRYLSIRYVEALRDIIIKQYHQSPDPVQRGYKNRGDLEFIMEFIVSMYNRYTYKRYSIIRKASWLLYNIASKHPFADGNKRTALATCDTFLEYNGYILWELPYRESYNFITKVAKGEKQEEDCKNFIRKYIKKLTITKECMKHLSDRI